MKSFAFGTACLSVQALLAEAHIQAHALSPARHMALVAHTSSSAVVANGQGAVHYGDTKCPCIGFDNIDGETMAEVNVGHGRKVQVSYPADLGARCENWDDNRYPGCREGEFPGPGKGFCAQSWCYVDPCQCGIDVLPKLSAFTPDATYRGKPLFWSYESCGGSDMFTKKAPKIGNPHCRCIGFAGVSGTTEISFKDGKMVEYPADLGTSCKAWDDDFHPECTGDDQPNWCKARWCYVDPCDCQLPGGAVPKISSYLPDATFTGKNLYYSFESCGSPDTWTEEGNPDACVNQMEEKVCVKNTRCAWTGDRCLGTELVNHPLCKDVKLPTAASDEKSGAAILGWRAAFAGAVLALIAPALSAVA